MNNFSVYNISIQHGEYRKKIDIIYCAPWTTEIDLDCKFNSIVKNVCINTTIRGPYDSSDIPTYNTVL